MIKVKQWGSILLVGSLLLLSACGSQGGNGEAGEASSNGDKQTSTFNMFFDNGIPEYPGNGGEAKPKIIALMNKAGITDVDYQVTLLSGDEYNTKLNLLASSGELPDYFSVNPTTLSQFVDQGLVMPLDDLLAKAPHITQQVPKERWEGVTFDGKIYAVPFGVRPESFNSPNTSGLIIRQDWMDKLNLKQPTTLDELHDVLTAFVQKDPDGNGIKDTYGMSGSKGSQFSVIFGAFGIAPSYWIEKDGKIVKGFTTPEAKETLSILQTWYKEGLIDPEFPVMEGNQAQSKIINSKVGSYEGPAFDVNPKGSSFAEALAKASPSAVLKLIPPPKGPQGLNGYPEANPYAGGGLRAISAKTPHPEKLMQLLDWSVSENENGGVNLLTYGEENVDYTIDKEKNLIKQTSSYADLYKKGFSNPVRFIQVTDRRWAEESVRDGLETAAASVVKNALWKTVPAELDYPDLEKKLWTEYFVKIVTGVWSLDKFDEFVQKYYAQGGQKIQDQANEEWKKNQGK
ncbi:extracellular solute-binding protein [Paenibacillus dokdonensis]|uniref:extracellular solute-binding protein n=1 Tax=Paenibacillus dokdonensis TaxID=2567944 RepID=UPI0010A841AC|nr:extracellular solute-binding protein [Paenibacillus dokdonensis]